MKLTLIGPLENQQRPSRTGGAIVLYREVLDEIERRGIEYRVIDTNKHNYDSKLATFLSVLKQYIKFGRDSDKTIFYTSTNYKQFLLPLWILSRLNSNVLVVRKFGGELESELNSGSILSWYLNWLLKLPSLLFVETVGLRDYLKNKGIQAFQVPNSRTIPSHDNFKTSNSFNGKLVYINRLSKDKGVNQLIALDGLLENGTSIDVYGPEEDIDSSAFEHLKKVKYKGYVSHNQVFELLHQYDAVILPTQFKGEGYPGIIIEALIAGKPVITTQWKYIPELIQDSSNGVLMSDNSTESMLKAIDRMSKMDYKVLAKNAKMSSAKFDIKHSITRILSHLN